MEIVKQPMSTGQLIWELNPDYKLGKKTTTTLSNSRITIVKTTNDICIKHGDERVQAEK